MTPKSVWIGVVSLAMLAATGCAGTPSSAASGSPPQASPDPAIAAYKTLMSDDDNTMARSTSNHCNSVQDADCPAAVARVLVTLHQWLDDLVKFSTPARFVTIDAQMRKHLSAAITDLNAIVVANRARNQAAEDRALQTAVGERRWLDEITSSIANSYQSRIADYTELVRSEELGLGSCEGCRELAGPGSLVCSGHVGEDCDAAVSEAAGYIDNFESSVVENRAPAELAVGDELLQSDLAKADDAILAMRSAMLSLDQTGFSAGRLSYQHAVSAVAADVAAV